MDYRPNQHSNLLYTQYCYWIGAQTSNRAREHPTIVPDHIFTEKIYNPRDKLQFQMTGLQFKNSVF